MTDNELPESFGVEARLQEHDPDRGLVWASYKLLPPFPTNDWLEVSVQARVYNKSDVLRLGGVPDTPVAEGPEIDVRARTEQGMVPLPLPPRYVSEWAVVPKVRSVDPRFRKPFEPSRCYVGLLRYGFTPGSTTPAQLQAAWAIPENRAGLQELMESRRLLVLGPKGELLRPHLVNDKLDFEPMASP